MIYGSVCSGIEAASVAWEPLGWECAWLSEIAPFPCAVLQNHYPDIPNLGDMTRIHEDERFKQRPIELLVGGTPCQSFSIAGFRKGLADPRGNLALVFLGLIDRARPKWIVWENVYGVLSSNGGRDFGTFVTALGQLGYGWTYRVLDAQFFGVPQRRRRVFVVGYLGDWRYPAAVLFERSSLLWNPAQSRKKGNGPAREVSHSLKASGGFKQDTTHETYVVQPISVNARQDPITSDKAQPLDTDGSSQAIMFDPYNNAVSDMSPSLGTNCGVSTGRNIAITSAAAFKPGQSAQARSIGYEVGVSPSLEGGGGGNNKPAVHYGMTVRRLMPIEAERLQGLQDNWTQIPWRGRPAAECPDGPRYKAVGNSMAVPCMEWIGRRIQAVEDAIKKGAI